MKPTILLPFSIFILLLVSSCNINEEPVVEHGKTITFDFVAGFDNGTLFDTTFEVAAVEAGIYKPDKIYEPIRIVYGQDSLFIGLQEALLGMKADEIKNVRVPPEKAYGQIIEDSIVTLPKAKIDNSDTLKINDVVTVVSQDGKSVASYVKEIGKENITVDINHPLAGEFIQFSILVRSIE